jgi:TnpA family transposase
VAARVAGRLDAGTLARLLGLVEVHDPDTDAEADEDPSLLRWLKSSTGDISLSTMHDEVDKLETIRSFALPAKLLGEVAPKVVAEWRNQAMIESPSHMRRHPEPLRAAMLAALLVNRQQEITDQLVRLLVGAVRRIGLRAEKKVAREMVNQFTRVASKESLLLKVADAALRRPDDTVRQVVYPVMGEDNLQNLAKEYASSRTVIQQRWQASYQQAYSRHYRQGLIRLLQVLEFRCENSHQPVLEALAVVRRHAAETASPYYPDGETVPWHRGLSGLWEQLVLRTAQGGRKRVVRSLYELRTLDALCDQLNCKGVWVVGAEEFRNPDEDLQPDFAERRTEHYAALAKPLDATEFIAAIRAEHEAELGAFEDALPSLDFLEIAPRGKDGAIKLTPLDAVAEPQNLTLLKQVIVQRWGMVPLIDTLKEAVLRSNCRSTLASLTGKDAVDEDFLYRLLLCLYAYGTNTGVRAVANAGAHGHSEKQLYYVAHRYLTPELVQALAIDIANATFRVRQRVIWGGGSTAVASDSTHFGAWDQNVFTEWHSRYRSRGVLIYWHVERKSVVIHSQLIHCTASEVAAMIDGAMHHGSDMDVRSNYVDTHGQSLIGFGLTRLLGFDLLPRIKRINHLRLYPPTRGWIARYPGLAPAMVNRAIDWDLIAREYDHMIKYAISIKNKTASTAAIMRRFHSANAMNDTFQAMQELGRVQRTIFACRYLRDRELQREINSGLNVAESWNYGNSVIFYGKGGDIPGNKRDQQELSVLCLRALQASIGYLNTLMIQDVLGEGLVALTAEDERGLNPLFWSNISPYGEVKLDMRRRITLTTDQAAVTPDEDPSS